MNYQYICVLTHSPETRKIYLLIVFTLAITSIRAQNAEQLEEFTASNGRTYKIGDELSLLVALTQMGNLYM